MKFERIEKIAKGWSSYIWLVKNSKGKKLVLKEVQEAESKAQEAKSEPKKQAGRVDLTEEGKLPFPRATITKIVRKNISQGKQIKGTVKDEMNLWVAKMIERIAGKMNSQPYTFVNYDMLKEAIAPYENVQGINEEREELLIKIGSIKDECDSIINEIEKRNKSMADKITSDEEKLPFPKATITNKLREELDEGKTIKGPVKKGLNIWLGKLVGRVSQKMDSYPYAYIDRSMFKDATETYEAVGEIELQKERIIQQMESIKTGCDLFKMEIDRKFRI